MCWFPPIASLERWTHSIGRIHTFTTTGVASPPWCESSTTSVTLARIGGSTHSRRKFDLASSVVLLKDREHGITRHDVIGTGRPNSARYPVPDSHTAHACGELASELCIHV